MKNRIRPVQILAWFVEALVLSVVLLYLGEYFDWPWVREAGGGVVAGMM